MKILLFIPDIDQSSGGTATWVRTLEEELGKQVDLHIATLPTHNPVQIQSSTIHHLKKNVFNGLKKEWNELLNLVKPDLVHINCCWMPITAYTLLWSKAKGYTTLLTPHGMLEPWIIKRNYWTKKIPAILLYQKKTVKNADMIHATAESEKENLNKLGWNKNIEVVVNGIDVQNIAIKKDWSIKKKMLFLSRVHPKKGIEILLDAITEIKESLQNYKVLIAGEGEQDYIEALKLRSRKSGIDNIIQFIDAIYGDEKYLLFQEADVFILPTFSENFGLVVAEALSSGTPVITTTGTPWQDLAQHNCGWWIENNTENLSRSILDAISKSENQLQEMGTNGRSLIEDKYSNVAMAKDIKNLYNKLLTGKDR